MKPAMLIGIVLIVFGIVSLAYQGITYTTHKKVLQIGSLRATTEKHNTIPLPPVLGGIAIVGGIALMAVGGREA